MRNKFALLILLMPALLTLTATSAFCKTDMPPLLTKAGDKVQAELGRIDAGLKQSAQLLGSTGLTGDKARATLAGLCRDFDYAVDCAVIDLQGKMVTIEPPPFRKFEGKDVSGQEQIKQVLKTGKPAMSAVFKSVEGLHAVDAEYPVTTPEGRRLGFVSILFQPEKMLGEIIVPLLQGLPMDIWVMEKGGRILYDVDSSQIGLNLFTSKLYRPYTSLVQLGRRIAKTREGNGIYEFPSISSTKIVKKKTSWKSVSLYGAEWRLVAIHVEQKNKARKIMGGPVGTAIPEQKLESFAATQSLIGVLAAQDKTKGMQLFKSFYDEAPGIYSVQWIDAKGINRFGYPRENSLNDYDYNAQRAADDLKMLAILAAKKPAVWEGQLREGKTGIGTFRPVFDQQRYLGMIYYLRLKP